VFSQVTANCVSEKGETPAGLEPTSPPAIAAMAPWTMRPQWLGTLAYKIFVTCITVSFLSLFEVRAPMLARSFNLQAGTSPHNAYYYTLYIRALHKVSFDTKQSFTQTLS
jgi:hypothetical protein